MIRITLNQIRAEGPCREGWRTLLVSKPDQDPDEPFPLVEVLDSNGLDDTLWCLRALTEYSNLWRQYAIWCARKVQHLLVDPRSVAAIVAAEKHIEGLLNYEELLAAHIAAHLVASDLPGLEWNAANAAIMTAEPDAGVAAAGSAAWALAAWTDPELASRSAAQEDLLRTQTAKLREILTTGGWV